MEDEIKKLDDIILKLADKDNSYGLAEEDYQILREYSERLKSDKVKEKESAKKKPIISMGAGKFLEWRNVLNLEFSLIGYAADMANADSPVCNREFCQFVRLVNPEDLRKAVIEILRTKIMASELYMEAVFLAGICSYSEGLSYIKDILSETEDDELADMCLKSMIMLEETPWKEFAKYTIFSYAFEKRKKTFYAYCRTYPVQINREEIIPVLEKEEDADLIRINLDLFAEYCSGKDILGTKIEKVISEYVLSENDKNKIANALINAGDFDLINKFWEEEYLGKFIATKMTFSGHTEFIPLLYEQLERDFNQDSFTMIAIKIALAGLGEADKICNEKDFSDEDWTVRLTAVWCSLFTDKYDKQLQKAMNDEDNDISAPATIVYLLKNNILGSELDMMVPLVFGDFTTSIELLKEYFIKKNLSFPPEIFHLQVKECTEHLNIEEVLEYYMKNKYLLAKWIKVLDTSTNKFFGGEIRGINNDQYTRGMFIAGLLREKDIQVLIEDKFVTSNTLNDKLLNYLALRINGKVKSKAGKYLERKIIKKDDSYRSGDLPIAVSQIVSGCKDDDLCQRLLSTNKDLITSERELAAYLLNIAPRDFPINYRLLKKLSRKTERYDNPFLKDIAKIINNAAGNTLRDLACGVRFTSCHDEKVKLQLINMLENQDDAETEMAMKDLLHDDSTEVGVKALAYLYKQNPDSVTLKYYVNKHLRSRDYFLLQGIVEMVKESGDKDFLPSLLYSWFEIEDDVISMLGIYDVIKNISEFNGLNIIPYSVKEPQETNALFASFYPINEELDPVQESARIALLALEERSTKIQIDKYVGKKILINFIKDEIPDIVLPNLLTRVEFDPIAIYLSVMYVDEDTGKIVAEVTKNKTGEIINALFARSSRIAFQAAWS